MNEETPVSKDYFTGKEAAALLGITESTFNNAVYRYGLARELRDKRWYYPQSSIDRLRDIRAGNGKPKQSATTAPLTDTPPSEVVAMHDLDPLVQPEPVQASDAVPVNNFELMVLRTLMEQMRAKVNNEQAEKFIAELRGIRDTVTTLIDTIIDEYSTINIDDKE